MMAGYALPISRRTLKDDLGCTRISVAKTLLTQRFLTQCREANDHHISVADVNPVGRAYCKRLERQGKAWYRQASEFEGWVIWE